MDSVNVQTADGSRSTVDLTAIDALDANAKGRILLAGDQEYESSRKIWNGFFDRKPSIIARCMESGDVVKAVKFARDNSLLLSVKGGGHNSAGTAAAEDGMMVDLSLMRQVTVDGRKKTARVEGGALLSDVDFETQQHGLAVSAGIISHTGVGGLTLGGGFGWISRKHGLSVDNLISAEVVTADGRKVTASAEQNQDLFWGIRGGGGNFGIVTSFEFQCAQIGTEVFSGLIVKKFADARKYMQFHRDFVRGLPDEMTVWMVVRHAPPLPFLNEAVHGSMVVIVPFVWLGEKDKGEELVKPIRSITASHGEAMGMNPWVNWQSGFDGLVEHGARNYWKSHHLTDLSDGCIDAILEFASKLPTDECEVFIPHMEGVPGRVSETRTAFAHRRTPFLLNIHTRWRKASDDEKCIRWAKDFHDRTQPFAKGVYVNFLSQEGEDRVKEAYTPEVWERLVAVKKKWDPTNLFRLNQNIRP
ncbi:MAG: FAD-linked oxidase [Deltaproteobacteria bacterium SG8_13]|nr:MAG: FAD-linked oxidase [Deltaproteobacteria bacterium SG8_13]